MRLLAVTETADYLAAYDIAHPRRLRRALKVLLDHAISRQKSVFEVRLDARAFDSLRWGMEDVIDPDEDRFMLLRLSSARECDALGIAPRHIEEDFFLVS